MHIITIPKLRQFYEKHTDSEIALKLWIVRAKHGHWNSFADVKRDCPSVRTDRRFTIFNIKGDHYRLLVRIEYQLKRIYIRYILTHEEYSQKRWKKDEWYT
jgi:mRNA interferase HigB